MLPASFRKGLSLARTAPSEFPEYDRLELPVNGPSVSRCVCFNIEFEKIKQIADVTGGGLLEAHRQTGCGARCGLCLPYIQVMLKTGQTKLPIMWADDFRRFNVNPGRVNQVQRSLSEGRYRDPGMLG